MKNTIFTLFFLLITTTFLQAQLPANCNTPAPRIIMAGDSWAQYMADDDTHNKVLKMYGQADKTTISSTFEVGILCGNDMPASGDPYYTVSGSLASQWADEANFNYIQNLINAINAEPDVDAVMLSIGGNDILAGRSGGGWYFDMDLDVPGSEQALFDQITADMLYIMNRVWTATRPDMQFIISSYDFPNFNIEGGIPITGPSYGSFYAFGKREDLSRDENGDGEISGSEHLITDAELNTMMTLVEQIRKDIADNDSRIFYDNGQGLMHYFYGYDDSPYPPIAPGATPYPEGATPYTGGGDPNVPTDLDNFRTVAVCGIGSFPADPIHLDAEAYEYKIKNQFDNIFFENYRGSPDATFFSDGANDGYVDVIEQEVENNGIRVGDDGPFCCWGGADNDYRGIFSFNTASLPDNANITGASLYMIRSGVNDNPFDHDKDPILDIKSGYFGSSPGLEWTDGTDAADASNIGCFHGEAEEDDFAIRVDLNGGLAFINPTGTTQLRMSFTNPDWSVEYINFYDGGGATALLPPEIEAMQSPPVYEYTIIKRSYESDGTETDEVIERGPEVLRRDGYVYQDKLESVRETDEGDQILTFVMMAAIEHTGLARYMLNNYGAPGNGFAPFLDVTYELLLPAELAYFTARAQEKDVLLSWQTISEQNTDYFAIEHSVDGQTWRNIGESQAAKNSTESLDYQYTHLDPIVGKNFYRLQTHDLDGKAEYSEIRTVNFKRGAQDLTIFPNPFSDNFTVATAFNNSGNARLEISDVFGRVISKRNLNVNQGAQEITINDLANASKGTYILQIYFGNEVYLGKVVKR